jgi:iron complex transport system substrate-binding protein
MGLVIILGSFVSIFITRTVGGKSARFFMAQQKYVAATEGVVEEMINGGKVIKVFNHEEEAEAFFSKSLKTLDTVLSAGDSLNTAAESAGRKTVTFFYITTSGYANVRKPGDYISKMIALAGGEYFYPVSSSDSENSLSTLNMDLETFYTTSKNADILIYNSTVETDLTSIDDLLKKSPLLADFKAVKTGDVWCTNQNMFQQISGTADMIAEMYSVIHDDGDVGTRGDLVYLHKLS